jgi:predicted ATP-grasp superfamily ATP-dependent carboligase
VTEGFEVVNNTFKDLFIKDIDGYIILNPKEMLNDKFDQNKLIEIISKMKNKVNDYFIAEKYTSLLAHISDSQKFNLDDFGKY